MNSHVDTAAVTLLPASLPEAPGRTQVWQQGAQAAAHPRGSDTLLGGPALPWGHAFLRCWQWPQTHLLLRELYLRGEKPPTAVLRPSGERATKQTIFIHSWGGRGDTPGQSKSRHWEGNACLAQHSSHKALPGASISSECLGDSPVKKAGRQEARPAEEVSDRKPQEDPKKLVSDRTQILEMHPFRTKLGFWGLDYLG